MAEDRTWASITRRYGRALELGDGSSLRWSTDLNDMVVGAIRDHRTPEGSLCASGVFFGGPAVEVWRAQGKLVHELVSWEPFTLDPSLLCRACGSHGWVKESVWIPA